MRNNISVCIYREKPNRPTNGTSDIRYDFHSRKLVLLTGYTIVYIAVDGRQAIMRNLVRRYVTVQQRRAECGGVTEDDVNEIKQDVSAFRCELVEILRNSGMNTSTANAGAPGKQLTRAA